MLKTNAASIFGNAMGKRQARRNIQLSTPRNNMPKYKYIEWIYLKHIKDPLIPSSNLSNKPCFSLSKGSGRKRTVIAACI